MTTQEVAIQLVELCKRGEFMKAVDTLYSKDIVSVEPHSMNGMPAEMRGFDAVHGKSVWFMDNHVIHSCTVTGPFIANDKFIVEFDLDVTHKQSQKRMQMKEAGLYAVANGKVIREDFFMLPAK